MNNTKFLEMMLIEQYKHIRVYVCVEYVVPAFMLVCVHASARVYVYVCVCVYDS